MRAAVSIVRIGITEGVHSLSHNHAALRVLQGLIDLSVGWSDVRGKAKTRLEDKLEDSLLGLSIITTNLSCDTALLSARNNLLELLLSDIENFTMSERVQIDKLEKRMIDSEAGQYKLTRSRMLAGQLLNEQMENMVLPRAIVEFLQGHWFESLQLMLTRQGLESDGWKRATKLTETLIGIMQPVDEPEAEDEVPSAGDGDTNQTTPDSADSADPEPRALLSQDTYKTIEHLPGELKESLVSLKHNPDLAETVLTDIESVCVDLMSGVHLEYFEYQPVVVASLNGSTRFALKSPGFPGHRTERQQPMTLSLLP
ncbi:MAG: DUF1631 family protein [bacterium]|nr:DUF1631 family protein [Gammaproteobacteria bacterium]HIL97828.1 DUF1631 family protein [Pseudomonadales bacterium]